ncbi:MAG: TMEM165/GDT1 family protein [Candidatus Hadarchaeota archaeon]
MDLTPFLSAFGVVAVAELGGKTQLAAITLSTRYKALSVFAGAILAVAPVDGASILAGTVLGELFPTQLISMVGAFIFIGWNSNLGFWGREGDQIKAREVCPLTS